MGVSTDGQICYGILYEEDYEFPWASARNGDEDEWWQKVRGFSPSFYPFTKEGKFSPGVGKNDPRIHVKLVNVCSGDCPIYVLATPSSVLKANRGYPERFNPADLVIEAREESALLEFCGLYGISIENGPQWYLSSYWG